MKKISNLNSGVYFRSSANNWGLNNEFVLMSDGSYVAKNVLIRKGRNEFKVADANWSSGCNYSYSSDKPVMLYHNYVLTNNMNNNVVMNAHSDYLVNVYLHNTPNGMVMRMHSAN